MLQPKKRKYRKEFRGKIKGIATKGNDLAYGQYGLQAKEAGWYTSRQIEATRRVITRFTKRGGKLWIRIFPHKPITKKGAGAKMGSGKGDIDTYVAVIRPGTVLFELSGVSHEMAKEAMRRAGHKVPMKTQFISRE